MRAKAGRRETIQATAKATSIAVITQPNATLVTATPAAAAPAATPSTRRPVRTYRATR